MNEWVRIYFQATGPAFRPDETALEFSSSFPPGAFATFGGRRGQVVAFGGALYRVPDDLPRAHRESELQTAFGHIAALLPAFRAAGATDFILHMHRRTFEGQCNEEFTQAELRRLLALDCLFFFSARKDFVVDA